MTTPRDIEIAIRQSALEQLRAEIRILEGLPLSQRCPLTLEVMQNLVEQRDRELQDASLDLFKLISPRHSWLRVPVVEIKRLKLEGHISRFSYMSSTHYYLETDHDMTLYLDARDNEGRPVSGWDDCHVDRFPHLPSITRLDALPGYVSMA